MTYANGNISSATVNGKWADYTYDALNQMTRVNDRSDPRAGDAGSTWVYEYDQGGNILSKRLYPYANTSGTPLETTTFTYGTATWKDQLTAVNGVPITYDAIGNPLNDGEWTYTWQNGRQLAGMSKAGMNVAFKYNANGLRTRKIVNGVVTNYTLHGKTVVHMTRGNDELHFFYDAQNRPAVVVYNGTAYAYVKNLQGDIIAILDSAGSAVVRYTYDAWGMPTSIGGNMATTLGEINPFRYRGYVYDQETGLYYLRSRYYNSARCRFLNADDNLTSPHNLFRYCYPAPIQMVDPDGTEEFLEWLNSDEVVNRSFMLGCPLSFYGSLNLGNTAEVGSWASVRSGAMAYEANWTNSSYNTGYLTPTHNPVATLYRSISDAEYESIKTTGEFCLGGGAMEAKQFGLDYCETRRFGDWFNDSIIVSVQIDANTLHRTFDVRYHIDTTIFRHGVVTIHRDQLPDFNRLIYRNSIKFIQK